MSHAKQALKRKSWTKAVTVGVAGVLSLAGASVTSIGPAGDTPTENTLSLTPPVSTQSFNRSDGAGISRTFVADYGYSKMKDQILLVNELTGKIVEIIPETQPETTGQK
jgi:hypothetical protein